MSYFCTVSPAPQPPASPYHLPPVPQDWWRPEWPEVSVSIVTYNQAPLIGRALDSVLAQEVDFRYEIVVGDDCSTDGTRAILDDYRARHPNYIRLLLYEHKVPGIPGRANNMLTPMACRGRYTAWLDGDDYWDDPHKLQRQYDTMQRYPTLSCCLHDTLIREVDARGHLVMSPERRSDPPARRRRTGFYPHEEFCRDRNIKLHTSSLFFRSRIFGDWPDDFARVVAADHYMYLLITQRGPAYYEDVVSSVHERQAASLTNSVHYLGIPALRRRLVDLDLYRRCFPATRLTASYSYYAARHGKALLLHYLRRRRVGGALRTVARLLREPRGVGYLLYRKLSRPWRRRVSG